MAKRGENEQEKQKTVPALRDMKKGAKKTNAVAEPHR
jgi:hypothetical protein